MTEKRARAFHRAMWRWLAKHPGAEKAQWPGWGDSNEICEAFAFNKCFACFVVDEDCDACPIIDNANHCTAPNSFWMQYYELWKKGNDCIDPAEWADVCNRMADAWLEIPEGR